MFLVNWLDRVERKLGNIGIRGLMNYIIALNAVVFFLSFIDSSIILKLLLYPQLVMEGEVWRLITFAFIPPTMSPFWLIFALYFYYMIGSSLEHEWGTFKFNVYYFAGIIFTIIGAFISGGSASSIYLNMSLFLAFATIFPEFQVMLFFVLPVKMKYLALIDAAFIIYAIITQPLWGKIAAVASILNFLLFFGKDLCLMIFRGTKSYTRHRSYTAGIARSATEPVHRCEVCAATEKDNKNLEFRYCIDCEGDHEYCMMHLTNHEHVKKGAPENPNAT